MSNLIPDTNVRTAFITLLGGIGTQIFETRVPLNVDPIPAQRIILSTQTDNQANTNKCGHLWNHSILLDIISENPLGYSNKSAVEAIAQAVNSVIDVQEDIVVNGFKIYNTTVSNIHDMDYDTATKTINRKLVRYNFIIDALPESLGFPYTFPFILS